MRPLSVQANAIYKAASLTGAIHAAGKRTITTNAQQFLTQTNQTQMMYATEARKLLTQNEAIMSLTLEKIEAKIREACFRGETQILYPLQSEWLEPAQIKIEKFGYSVEPGTNNHIVIRW